MVDREQFQMSSNSHLMHKLKSPPTPFFRRALPSLALAGAGVTLMTALIYVYRLDGNFADVSMLYLLVVALSALILGRIAAIFVSLLSFLAFNWFFVEPRYRLTVADSSEWLALCMFLFTAIVIGELTALLRVRAEEADRNKAEATALADATWAIASELNRDRALHMVLHQLASVAQLKNATIVQINNEELETLATYAAPNDTTSADIWASVMPIARSLEWKKSGTLAAPANLVNYLSITLESHLLAVLYTYDQGSRIIHSTQQHIIESLLNHAALIVQRDELMKSEARTEALAEAYRLKTALLSMVSHDFRSPLTSIKASVGSLLQDAERSESSSEKTLLQTVDHEADRLNRMVGNILDLSHLEGGAWQPRREMIPLAELIGAALDSSFNKEDNDRIEISIDCSTPDLLVDSVQMVQVITNLIENALKYAPRSTVELQSNFNDESIIIQVLDRGAGLPAGEEQRVFEPFYRAPSLAESAIPGIGIGLAVCLGLVEANGGKLTAWNRDGGGAVFQITLPKRQPDKPADCQTVINLNQVEQIKVSPAAGTDTACQDR